VPVPTKSLWRLESDSAGGGGAAAPALPELPSNSKVACTGGPLGGALDASSVSCEYELLRLEGLMGAPARLLKIEDEDEGIRNNSRV
jgi:hypothetical protein